MNAAGLRPQEFFFNVGKFKPFSFAILSEVRAQNFNGFTLASALLPQYSRKCSVQTLRPPAKNLSSLLPQILRHRKILRGGSLRPAPQPQRPAFLGFHTLPIREGESIQERS